MQSNNQELERILEEFEELHNEMRKSEGSSLNYDYEGVKDFISKAYSAGEKAGREEGMKAQVLGKFTSEDIADYIRQATAKEIIDELEQWRGGNYELKQQLRTKYGIKSTE